MIAAKTDPGKTNRREYKIVKLDPKTGIVRLEGRIGDVPYRFDTSLDSMCSENWEFIEEDEK